MKVLMARQEWSSITADIKQCAGSLYQLKIEKNKVKIYLEKKKKKQKTLEVYKPKC